MKYDPAIQPLRSIRLPEYDYSHPGVYFITLVTHARECLFGEVVDGEMRPSPAGLGVREVWDSLPARHPTIELGPAVVMPNHFHGIIHIVEMVGVVGANVGVNVGAIHESPLPKSPQRESRRNMILPLVIGYFKMNTAKQINKMRNTLAIPVWQRNYYEHIVRSEKEYETIEKSILSNPDNWFEDDENTSRSG